MHYDRDKLSDMEDRLDGYLAELESARESKRLAEMNLVSATATVQRAANMPMSLFDPPGRYRRSGEGEFLHEFYADPAKVLALFRREAPEHAMTGLLEHHAEMTAALNKAQKSLSIHQARVNALTPTVSRCREFIRRIAA